MNTNVNTKERASATTDTLSTHILPEFAKDSCIIDYHHQCDYEFKLWKVASSIAKDNGIGKCISIKKIAQAMHNDQNVNFWIKDNTPSEGQKALIRYNSMKGVNILPSIAVIIAGATSSDPTTFISAEGTGCTSNGPHPLGAGDYLRMPSNVKRIAKAYAETTNNNVYVILVVDDEPLQYEIYTPTDLFPNWQTGTVTDSKQRKTMDIWGRALGFEFSSPLYERDLQYKDPTFFVKRHGISKLQDEVKSYFMTLQNKLKKDYEGKELSVRLHANTSAFKQTLNNLIDPDTSQPASSLNKFRVYHKITNDAEISSAYDIYAAMRGYDKQENRFVKSRDDLLTDDTFLMPGYTLCPECHRPVYKVNDEYAELELSNSNNIIVTCNCGHSFEIEPDIINASFRFDEERDTSDENCEMLTDGDDIFDSITETQDAITGATSDFNKFDEISYKDVNVYNIHYIAGAKPNTPKDFSQKRKVSNTKLERVNDLVVRRVSK